MADSCAHPHAGFDGETFAGRLARLGLSLVRAETVTLQVNTGLKCNQACLHCHLHGGPNRAELMTRDTAIEVIEFAQRGRFQAVDITGGAPELNPNLLFLIESLGETSASLSLRTNLSVLCEMDSQPLLDSCARIGVKMIGSLPALNEKQTDAQRGPGVFEKSIRALKLLNSMGYGATGPLELHLVCNPSGAFMAAPQEATEKRYKKELAGRFGVSFGTLMSFSNAPLGRFKDWLIRSANYEAYIKRLSRSFNPATIPGLMCRSLISVSWDGFLYDCDFNIACDSPAGGARVHVKDAKVPLPGSPIAVGNHCYACAAGAGFT